MLGRTSAVEHKTSSVNATTGIACCTKPSVYYGCTVVNGTTAGVTALIYDGLSNTGTLVDVASATSGTYAVGGYQFVGGVAMHTGIYIYPVISTSGSDSIIVFFGGVG